MRLAGDAEKRNLDLSLPVTVLPLPRNTEGCFLFSLASNEKKYLF